MECEINRADSTAELALLGDVTIEDVAVLRDALLEQYSMVDELIVNMSGVSQIDLTCLQLFCSYHLAAIKGGKTISLLNISGPTRSALVSLGFIRHVGCRNDSNHNCLWVEKNSE